MTPRADGGQVIDVHILGHDGLCCFGLATIPKRGGGGLLHDPPSKSCDRVFRLPRMSSAASPSPRTLFSIWSNASVIYTLPPALKTE